MEVIPVRMTVRGLHHHLLRARDHRARRAPAPRRREKTLLDGLRDEDVLDAGIGIGDEAPAAGGLPRRVYKPTAYGKQLLSASVAMRRRLVPVLVPRTSR